MIDPVNMQNVVTRAPEVARVQRVQEGALSAQGQVFAQELARQAQQVEETVASPPQAQRGELREKRKKEREKGTKTKVLSSWEAEAQTSGNREVSGELGHLIDTTA